jgi:hypothetical protein
MFRLLIKVSMCILFIGCVNAFAAEYCSADKINQKIEGVWEGSDSYYFDVHINSASKLCISILEDGSDTVRNIRDIVIIDGKLAHLSYFTPITKAYVVYTNIQFVGDEMKYDWYSSYENRGGKDSYFKRKARNSGAPMTENRDLPVERTNYDLTSTFIY